jgi:hypothetical protein
MPRFYFHKHVNGQTVPDRRGTSLRNENDACARRSLHAFGSQEIGQSREEHLPFLGGVGRRTHDLCCERKSRYRDILRPHLGLDGLGTFFQGCRFCSQHCRAAMREALLRLMSGPGYPRRVRLSCRTPPASASAPGHPRSHPVVPLCGIDSH